MNNYVKEAFEMIEKLIEGKYDPLAFSYDFPGFLCENFEKIKVENPYVAKILNENMPEVCDEYERGEDPKPFIDKVKVQYMLLSAENKKTKQIEKEMKNAVHRVCRIIYKNGTVMEGFVEEYHHAQEEDEESMLLFTPNMAVFLSEIERIEIIED